MDNNSNLVQKQSAKRLTNNYHFLKDRKKHNYFSRNISPKTSTSFVEKQKKSILPKLGLEVPQ